jgi:hypothetical protein
MASGISGMLVEPDPSVCKALDGLVSNVTFRPDEVGK